MKKHKWKTKFTKRWNNTDAMKKNYDYLIVGSGLFAATCDYELNKRGYKVLVVEKRNNVAGNI